MIYELKTVNHEEYDLLFNKKFDNLLYMRYTK